jgi:hypothetical protein
MAVAPARTNPRRALWQQLRRCAAWRNGAPPYLLLTPKFGKESDSWVQLDEESVWLKERSFQMYSVKRSAVGYLFPFGRETVELILRDWMVTWLKQERRMDR